MYDLEWSFAFNNAIDDQKVFLEKIFWKRTMRRNAKEKLQAVFKQTAALKLARVENSTKWTNQIQT